jgi:endoglucanase
MISLKRGVNLSHWLSQSDRRGDERRAWIARDDFRRIRAFGFDHVRLPLDEVQLWTEAGERETEAWDLLERALDWAEEEDLRMVCDLHILRSHFFDQKDTPALYTDRTALDDFLRLWRELAPVLAARSPDRVALEILNEAVARDTADWNRVSGEAFRTIREAAPRHDIVLGSNWYCMCKSFDTLEIPDDPRKILTFHFYNPMAVTHNRANWTPLGGWDGPISYPGPPWPEGVPESVPEPLRGRMAKANVPWGPGQMEQELSLPLARASVTGSRLYCGEFGVHAAAPTAIRRAWLGDAVRTFESHGIGWAVWDWKGVFGVVDREGRSTGIERALFQDRRP